MSEHILYVRCHLSAIIAIMYHIWTIVTPADLIPKHHLVILRKFSWKTSDIRTFVYHQNSRRSSGSTNSSNTSRFDGRTVLVNFSFSVFDEIEHEMHFKGDSRSTKRCILQHKMRPVAPMTVTCANRRVADVMLGRRILSFHFMSRRIGAFADFHLYCWCVLRGERNELAPFL